MILAAATTLANVTEVVNKTKSAYGPYILVLIPIAAACIAWFINRVVRKLDKANEDRMLSLIRHTNKNADAVAALTTLQTNATNNLTGRIVSVQEVMTALMSEMGQRVARIEGRLEIPNGGLKENE